MPAEYYKSVPRELVANLQFRRKVLYRCADDERARQVMLEACRQDVLFWMSTFCWCFEPRPKIVDGKKQPNAMPFIPWEHQVPAILEIRDKLGYEDIGVLKSRGEGMSWMAVLFAVHDFLFDPMSKVGLVSRNELAGDSPDDPDSLGWKISWELSRMPRWMPGVTQDVDYERNLTKHTWKNLVNGSTIASYSATGDVASGGRSGWFLAQPHSSLLATPTGWTHMGAVRVGDRVIGTDGNHCNVIAVHEHGFRDVYAVEFSDGQVARCCDDHLWPVITTSNRHSAYQRVSKRRSKWGFRPYDERWERMPLRELMGDYRQTNGKWKKAKYHIPMTAPVIYDPVDLPLHPYLIGVWLGDGYASKSNGLCLASNDPFIVDTVRGMLPPAMQIKQKKRRVYIATGTERGSNPLKDEFGRLDMLRQKTNKRIPDAYLRGTPEQRLELIRGLMDTDGTCQGKPDKPSSFCEYTTIARGLADGMVQLVQSLGGYCKVNRRQPVRVTGGKRVPGKMCYKISLAMPAGACPFSLPRKVERYRDRIKYPPTRTIVDIRPSGQEPCRCITVDAANHLYLTDGFAVTSNCDELAKFPAGRDREAMASTQYVTNSRLIVSTPKGTEGAYYDVMHEPSGMTKITLHWTANPTRNRGLYRFENGKPVAIDPVSNPLPPNYDPPTGEILNRFSRIRRKGFKLEGNLRSAWYDHECDRPGATPQNVAQELDLDFGGSMYRVFGDEFQAAAEKEVREPFHKGTMDYNQETLEPLFNTTNDGPCLLWTELDHRGKPPPHPYAAGADISTGLGGSYTSNSVIEVFDMLTMEQVFEFAVNTLSPTEFAEACVAVCKMFHDAYFAWESNGSAGGAFTKRMKELKYTNVYYRTQLTKRGRKKTKELGWLTTENTKGMMFGEFLRSVRNTELKIHSDLLVKECGQYIYLNGKIEHILAANTDDESSKGKAHGDRVIAACVGLQAVRDRPLASKALQEEIAKKVPQDSIAGRTREFEEEENRREQGEAWDDRTVWDLAHGRNRYAA